MNRIVFSLMLLSSGFALAQTGKVGINTENPTETFSVKGTTRIEELPTNGTANAIHTTEKGEASTSKNQTFNAVNTLVVDANGVVGKLEGLPVMKEKEDIKIVPFVSNSVPINQNTPTTSVTRLHNLEIRFNGTDNVGNYKQSFSIRIPEDAEIVGQDGVASPYENIVVNSAVWGYGGMGGVQENVIHATKGNSESNWTVLPSRNSQANIWYFDANQFLITLINTKELYRVTTQTSPTILNGYNYYEGKAKAPSQATVTIFIEKLSHF